jgi:2'-5' RNA ligase
VEGISACEQLAARVRSGPLAAQLTFPYHPHVTIAHDLDEQLLDKAFAELADFECVFEAAAFHLYEHHETTGWRPTESFRLSGAARRA